MYKRACVAFIQEPQYTLKLYTVLTHVYKKCVISSHRGGGACVCVLFFPNTHTAYKCYATRAAHPMMTVMCFLLVYYSNLSFLGSL